MSSAQDPREAAARYRLERAAADEARARGEEPPGAVGGGAAAGGDAAEPRGMSQAERAAFIEQSIQQAIRRGDFDDLPGAGKPLVGLGASHDPDWWIKRKIESEQLRGLGPPALTLRVENRQLDARLDELAREADVREVLEDFNRRVVEARRQLLGGPPVVTPTREVDAEVDAWRERRTAREAAEVEARAAARAASAASARSARDRLRWWPRRGRRRADGR
ncbi:MAG: DUF1992 domain-containing protein [Microbacterium sp.]|uniref:DnaJ family domain-containing protein n=1 Tax=unclassified Microbacterium TaxID=2609290 RepID=UPI000DB4E4AF|nr:DUF1992 domain-containing protein [Microbacterium sp.]PZU41552.1 MAG: DUF1992 domain-containing protein [Microbacterium sp.]